MDDAPYHLGRGGALQRTLCIPNSSGSDLVRRHVQPATGHGSERLLSRSDECLVPWRFYAYCHEHDVHGGHGWQLGKTYGNTRVGHYHSPQHLVDRDLVHDRRMGRLGPIQPRKAMVSTLGGVFRSIISSQRVGMSHGAATTPQLVWRRVRLSGMVSMGTAHGIAIHSAQFILFGSLIGNSRGNFPSTWMFTLGFTARIHHKGTG